MDKSGRSALSDIRSDMAYIPEIVLTSPRPTVHMHSHIQIAVINSTNIFGMLRCFDYRVTYMFNQLLSYPVDQLLLTNNYKFSFLIIEFEMIF